MNTKPIYVFAKWQVKEGNSQKVLALLAEVATQSRQEKGNLLYKVHQSNTDVNTILLYESYENEVAVNEHRNSVYFQQIVIGEIIPLLESREVVLASELLGA